MNPDGHPVNIQRYLIAISKIKNSATLIVTGLNRFMNRMKTGSTAIVNIRESSAIDLPDIPFMLSTCSSMLYLG